MSGDEGSQHTYSFTTTDPGTDNFALGATDCGLNGTQVGAATFNAERGRVVSSARSLMARRARGSVRVSDSDGASDTDSQDVACHNVAPTVALAAGNDLSVNEGTSHTYSFTVTDPGADTFSVVAVDCGANGTRSGTTVTPPRGGSFDCSFPDGPASSMVSVQVADSDNATATPSPKP